MKKLSVIFAVLIPLIMLCGCQFPIQPNDKKPNKTAPTAIPLNDMNQYQQVELSVYKVEAPVMISATGCEAFESKSNTVNTDEITGEGIIEKLIYCAEYGGQYDGTYQISGKGARYARYSITPTGKTNNQIQLGMNYDDVMIHALSKSCENVEVQFNSDISIKGGVGEFEFLVLAIDGDWHCGRLVTRISGVTENMADVSLAYCDEGYRLSSNTKLSNVKISGSDSLVPDFLAESTNTADQSTVYYFSPKNNGYSISKKEG